MKKSFIIFGLISSLLFAQEDNVKNLAQGLNLPSPAEGHRVATELEKGGAAAVAKLLELLQSANSTENTSATYALTALVANSPDKRDVIAQAMADGLMEKVQDDNAKCTVLKLLRLCANDGQIPAVAAQLGNSTVRPYAIMTLTSIGTPAAAKALVDAATKADNAVAFEYVSAFARLKPATATPVLLRIIDQVTPYQRVAVMNALAEIGNPIVADKLFDVLAPKARSGTAPSPPSRNLRATSRTKKPPSSSRSDSMTRLRPKRASPPCWTCRASREPFRPSPPPSRRMISSSATPPSICLTRIRKIPRTNRC